VHLEGGYCDVQTTTLKMITQMLAKHTEVNHAEKRLNYIKELLWKNKIFKVCA
jgi:hypothetical protein